MTNVRGRLTVHINDVVRSGRLSAHEVANAALDGGFRSITVHILDFRNCIGQELQHTQVNGI